MPASAACKSGVCNCVDGQTYVRGRCRKLSNIGEACEEDIDCNFGYDRLSVTCKNHVCECANGYYKRYGNICRFRSMDIDDPCVVNTDCSDLGKDIKCVDYSCQFEDETQPSSSISTLIGTRKKISTETSTASDISSQQFETLPRFTEVSPKTLQKSSLTNGQHGSTDTEAASTLKQQREIAIQTSIESVERTSQSHSPSVKNVSTATNFISWKLPYYRRRQHAFRHSNAYKAFSTLSNFDDDLESKKYGDFCMDVGQPCGGLAHSICANHICLCQQGYYQKNEKCFAELGEIADSVEECDHSFDEKSGRCLCQKNYFYEPSLRACKKPVHYKLSCTSNSQCSPFGPAYCRTDIPRRCTCEQYAEYDDLQQLCVFKQGLGAECDTQNSCTVEHSVCSNHQCKCKDKYVEKEGACTPGIGAVCETNTDCAPANSSCEASSSGNFQPKMKYCQCRKGYVHFNDVCLKEAEEIEDDCIETEQCKPLLGTCIDGKCTCTEEQHLKYGRCNEKKEIGATCTNAGECFTEKEPDNVECRNSVCQCKFGFQSDVEQRSCIRVIPNKKNSSGRPSVLKIITFLLIGSAILITTAALRSAYYM